MTSTPDRENQNQLVDALLDTALVLNSTLNLKELLDRILTNLGRVVPHGTANIMLIEGNVAHIVGGRGYEQVGLPSMLGHRFAINDYATLKEMAQTRRPCLISNTEAASEWVNRSDTRWIRSYAGAPISFRGEIVGFLNVASFTPNFYTDLHANRLRAFAEQAGTAIGNARLFAQAQQEIADRKAAEAQLAAYQEQLEALVQSRTAELEKAISEIAASRDQIDAILRSIVDGLIVTDLNHKVVLANPAAEALLGRSLQAMRGREIGALTQNTQIREVIRNTLHQNQAHKVDLILDYSHNGAQQILQARTGLVDDRDGEPVGVVTIIQDVTRLREVDRLKTNILTTAAHQLRTPLTSILGYSEILLNRSLDEARQQRFLTVINEQTTHLTQLVTDLLDVSRLEVGGDLEVSRQPVDMAAIITEAVEFFSQRSPVHMMQTYGLTSLPPVPGNRFRLAQVIWVLLSNAVDYSPNGGTITIVGRATADFVQIEIHDEGVGMSPTELDQLFEPFFRADPFQRVTGGGIGLGLVISKLIIEQHAGHIWLTSQPNRGTVAHVQLPLSPPPKGQMNVSSFEPGRTVS